MTAQTFSLDATLEVGQNNIVINSTTISLSSLLNMSTTDLSFGNSTSNVQMSWTPNVQIKLSNSTSNLTVTQNNIFVGSQTIIQSPKVTIFTSNGTWTKTNGCKLMKSTLVGGGGGGGAANGGSSTTSTISFPSWSGSTTYVWANGELMPDSMEVVVGAGGIGSNTSEHGSNGGITRIGSSGNTSAPYWSAPGGIRAESFSNINAAANLVCGSGYQNHVSNTMTGEVTNNTTPVLFSIKIPSSVGGFSYRTSGTSYTGPSGGETALFKGCGRGGMFGLKAGANGTSYGASGGGAVANSATGDNGGNGYQGIVIIEEWFGS